MYKVIDSIDTDKLCSNYDCSICGKQNVTLKWSINFPIDRYCCEHCRERDNFIKLNGYPIISDEEFKFWTSIFGYSKTLEKQAQRLNVKKTGSKVAHKQAQKTGSTPPYIRVEPLSLEPIFENELEPVFDETYLEDYNDDS